MKAPTLTVIGIDPGLSGALVCIREGTVLACLDTPVEHSTGNRNRLSAPVLAFHVQNLIKLYQPNMAALESVSAMPGQGVSSMFSFGRSLGAVEGILAALGVATTTTPLLSGNAATACWGTPRTLPGPARWNCSRMPPAG